MLMLGLVELILRRNEEDDWRFCRSEFELIYLISGTLPRKKTQRAFRNVDEEHQPLAFVCPHVKSIVTIRSRASTTDHALHIRRDATPLQRTCHFSKNYLFFILSRLHYFELDWSCVIRYTINDTFSSFFFLGLLNLVTPLACSWFALDPRISQQCFRLKKKKKTVLVLHSLDYFWNLFYKSFNMLRNKNPSMRIPDQD